MTSLNGFACVTRRCAQCMRAHYCSLADVKTQAAGRQWRRLSKAQRAVMTAAAVVEEQPGAQAATEVRSHACGSSVSCN